MPGRRVRCHQHQREALDKELGERARRIEEQVEHHNPTGCTHAKKWDEYCRLCEVVWLRESYQSAMRRAEYARQRLLAMGEIV